MTTDKVLAFWTPGAIELIVILAVMLLVFGRKLPETARNMGRSLLEFKKGLKEVDEIKSDIEKEVKSELKSAVDDNKPK